MPSCAKGIQCDITPAPVRTRKFKYYQIFVSHWRVLTRMTLLLAPCRYQRQELKISGVECPLVENSVVMVGF